MHIKGKLLVLSILFLLFNLSSAKAQSGEIADQIVAVVNDHIILQSEVDQRVYEYMEGTESGEFNEELWYQVLESLIDNYVLVEKARIDSVVVGDEEVNRVLDQRINQLVQRAGGEQELEQAFGTSLLEIKADYRDMFRQDMVVERVRQQRMGKVNITRPEVIEFFEDIPEESMPTIPESVSLSQVVVVPPPKADAKNSSFERAVQLRDSIITHGKSIEDLARRHSDGPTASNGGRLPMVPTSDLVTQYAAAASALEPGGISEVVETAQGYHIIRLDERSGDNIATHHILIEIQDDQLDEEFAINKLEAIRDSVINESKTFSALARTHSDDKNTAPSGGRLVDPQSGQRKIELNRLDASLSRVARQLIDEGEGAISEPHSFTPNQSSGTAFRIVQLREYIPQHTASLKTDYELIENYALQQKQQLEVMRWMQNIRDEVYVEYRIDVPEVEPVPETLPMDDTAPVTPPSQAAPPTAQPEETYN
ncbi:MAG: peptidylprolyl isomerase [Balneolales bacterium]